MRIKNLSNLAKNTLIRIVCIFCALCNAGFVSAGFQNKGWEIKEGTHNQVFNRIGGAITDQFTLYLYTGANNSASVNTPESPGWFLIPTGEFPIRIKGSGCIEPGRSTGEFTYYGNDVKSTNHSFNTDITGTISSCAGSGGSAGTAPTFTLRIRDDILVQIEPNPITVGVNVGAKLEAVKYNSINNARTLQTVT